MTRLEYLAKADKDRLVTKKDGTLKKYTKKALTDSRNGKGRFYLVHINGSGKFRNYGFNNSAVTIAELLKCKYRIENDSPRQGAINTYMKVTKLTYDNIMSLLK